MTSKIVEAARLAKTYYEDMARQKDADIQKAREQYNIVEDRLRREITGSCEALGFTFSQGTAIGHVGSVSHGSVPAVTIRLHRAQATATSEKIEKLAVICVDRFDRTFFDMYVSEDGDSDTWFDRFSEMLGDVLGAILAIGVSGVQKINWDSPEWPAPPRTKP